MRQNGSKEGNLQNWPWRQSLRSETFARLDFQTSSQQNIFRPTSTSQHRPTIMPVLDALAFPHLMDLTLDVASPDLLLVLRATSRDMHKQPNAGYSSTSPSSRAAAAPRLGTKQCGSPTMAPPRQIPRPAARGLDNCSPACRLDPVLRVGSLRLVAVAQASLRISIQS